MADGKPIALAVKTALKEYNTDFSSSWTMGENWSNVDTQFETFINKYLFPKIDETLLINIELGNRFNWLAEEKPYISQYSEEYVIMDTVPVAMNLNKQEELMLKRNYPRMATRLYNTGMLKKVKFTLNNNDVRLNFNTLGDATNYALGVYRKRLSDINVQEEKEIRAMVVDYAINQLSDSNIRYATSQEDLAGKVFEAILNMQNNSSKYNEANQASGGTIGQYTTATKLSDIAILTTDSMKSYLLDTKIANTFQNSGIDFTDHIISFDDLGGVYKATQDFTITEDSTVETFRNFGDYQVKTGDLVMQDDVFTFDVSTLSEFEGNVEEIKPQGELFAFIFDINALKYKRNTQDMLKEPFNNPEFDEVTYWLHYYSFKAVSPFFNKILITSEPTEEDEG